jgi:hypothetical protein
MPRGGPLAARLFVALGLVVLVLVLDRRKHASEFVPAAGATPLPVGITIRSGDRVGQVTDAYGVDGGFVTARWLDDGSETPYIRSSTLEIKTRAGSIPRPRVTVNPRPTQPPPAPPIHVVMADEAVPWSNTGGGKQRVAILAASRSTSQDDHVSTTALQSLLLPSIALTVTEREQHTSDIRLYVALDQDDLFWTENAKQLRSTAPWLQIHVRFYEKRGQRIPFVEIAAEAFADGADFFVRVNDDTEFLTPWIAQGVGSLRESAGVGVVGPTVIETASRYSLAARTASPSTVGAGAGAGDASDVGEHDAVNGGCDILTFDMVSRKHMQIFNTYYPTVFSAWYLDDWITQVYRPEFCKLLPEWRVAHHNKLTRYQPNPEQKALLAPEVAAGQARVRAWLAAHSNG